MEHADSHKECQIQGRRLDRQQSSGEPRAEEIDNEAIDIAAMRTEHEETGTGSNKDAG